MFTLVTSSCASQAVPRRCVAWRGNRLVDRLFLGGSHWRRSPLPASYLLMIDSHRPAGPQGAERTAPRAGRSAERSSIALDERELAGLRSSPRKMSSSCW